MVKNPMLIFLIMILIFLFGFTGCAKTGTYTEPDQYHRGTQGIELSFLYGTPPSRIYSGDDLSLVVEVINKGAYPNSDSGNRFEGKLFIGGFDPSYLPITPRYVQLDSGLYGRDQYNRDGTYDSETFRAYNIYLPDETDSYNPTIQATVCYKYKTFASPIVCVDPDPYSSNVKDKVCTVRDLTVSGGQGGPVAVTKIEQSVTRDLIKFKIYFRNMGNGYVIDPDYVNSDCPDTKRENVDKVDVQVRLSNAYASCRPENPVRLINGEGFVICDIQKPVSSIPAYTSPLQVELTYGYSTSITKQISIING